MKIIAHQNVASSVISVTGTATAIYTLVNTAGSVSNTAAFMNSPNNGGPANGIIITPEDGDIRIEFGGLVPTAALGMLLSQGTKYTIPNIDINQAKFIRVSTDVSCSIELIQATTADSITAVAESVSLEGTISISLDRTTDNVGAALATDALMDDTTALTPKFAVINATTNGDNTIVAAVVGKKIRVLAYSIVADAAVGVAFEDGAGGSELSGQMAFAANGGISVPFSPVGHFETTANTLLNIETDAAANVRGHISYIEV